MPKLLPFKQMPKMGLLLLVINVTSNVVFYINNLIADRPWFAIFHALILIVYLFFMHKIGIFYVRHQHEIGAMVWIKHQPDDDLGRFGYVKKRVGNLYFVEWEELPRQPYTKMSGKHSWVPEKLLCPSYKGMD